DPRRRGNGAAPDGMGLVVQVHIRGYPAPSEGRGIGTPLRDGPATVRVLHLRPAPLASLPRTQRPEEGITESCALPQPSQAQAVGVRPTFRPPPPRKE